MDDRSNSSQAEALPLTGTPMRVAIERIPIKCILIRSSATGRHTSAWYSAALLSGAKMPF
jgi:hypothetical protein